MWFSRALFLIIRVVAVAVAAAAVMKCCCVVHLFLFFFFLLISLSFSIGNGVEEREGRGSLLRACMPEHAKISCRDESKIEENPKKKKGRRR